MNNDQYRAKRNVPHLLQAQQAPLCLSSISETLKCQKCSKGRHGYLSQGFISRNARRQVTSGIFASSNRKARFVCSVVEHFHLQNYDFNSHVSLCCIEHDAQWSDDTRKAREIYWIRRLNTIQHHGINKGD